MSGVAVGGVWQEMQATWLWERPSTEVYPKCWRDAYKERHMLTPDWVRLWQDEVRVALRGLKGIRV